MLHSVVLAQEAIIGLSVIPPRLEITGKPGEVVTKQIKVRNESSVEKVISTTVRDFIVTDDQGTPVQLENNDQSSNRWAASNWIQVSPGQMRIKPGETKSLMVTVIIPEDALAGGHYAMILHSPNNDITINQTGNSIQTNVGTLVYITVPGDIKENAQVREFSAPSFSEYGPVNFRTIIANYSDIHIAPKGSINIHNLFGTTTATLALEDTNIFPNTSRQFENILNRRFLFGRYTADLSAGYGATGQALAATLIFWVIPWRLIILILVVIVITVILVSLLRKKSATGKEVEEEKVDELERELEDLKKKYQDRK
jgi:hypothetical protein